MISVDIRNDQVRPVNRAAVRAFLKEAIRFLLPGGSWRVGLVFVEDDQITQFNAKYLGEDRPTDVLAFSMREGKALAGDATFLGDIVISTETAKRNAKRFRCSMERELALYLVHGLLHLLGYEDKTPSHRRRMRRKERAVLERCRSVISLRSLVRP